MMTTEKAVIAWAKICETDLDHVAIDYKPFTS